MNKLVNGAKHYFTNYAQFHGRTSRATYWWAVLAFVILDTVVSIIFPSHKEVIYIFGITQSVDVNSPAENLWSLATIVPSISMLVRRLQDTGRSGVLAWLLIVPILGWIPLLYWTTQAGQAGPNKDGEVGA
ncbi:MAG: DUF805 domain-containing protein [Micrococcales bacterium]